jgi:hypothetical protein
MISSPKTKKMVLYRKICRPKNFREEINDIKQPCWCGEQWSDNHEDANHGPVLVQVRE